MRLARDGYQIQIKVNQFSYNFWSPYKYLSHYQIEDFRAR